MLVANLPYHVATPLIMNLLTATPRVQRMCFTIQHEVADRIFAQSGSREFGPLAIAVQTTCTLRRLARIPPQAFWPPPKVESSMVRLDRRRHPFEQGDKLERFIKLLRTAFAHRRKTLRYNLTRYLDEEAVTKSLAHIDGSERAERIDLADWTAMGEQLL
jgi:16S rRNA (adenine1518-N6/adenine1519-N6)-dimethyltransferase